MTISVDPHTERYIRKLHKTKDQLHQNLRFLVKRLPGRNSIEELERIAFLVDEISPEDGDLLRRMAGRLDEMRAHFYGPRKGYKRDPELI